MYFCEYVTLSLGQCWKHCLFPCNKKSSSLYGHITHWPHSMSCARHTQLTPWHKDTQHSTASRILSTPWHTAQRAQQTTHWVYHMHSTPCTQRAVTKRILDTAHRGCSTPHTQPTKFTAHYRTHWKYSWVHSTTCSTFWTCHSVLSHCMLGTPDIQCAIGIVGWARTV